MSRRTLLLAIIASALVSIVVVSLKSLEVASEWPDYVFTPDFWILFAQACGWYFLAGFLASVLTLFFKSKVRT